ncbi:dimethyl sulfoxide reductase anchor subunit [Eggerthellaceae bacterium zg-997]|nr:dimethyl sulfoxide reductase anchor subunit [Eggerthellaceae bacterium zg-997]
MEAAFAELPLALFTTLAPLGAGALLAMALVGLVAPSALAGEGASRALGVRVLVALAVAAVGFAASLFHLATPAHAPYVLANVGSSPLSNEIAAGVAFLVVGAVFCALLLFGRPQVAALTAACVVMVAVALAFGWFAGQAYVMRTIASWNTVLVPVQVVGFMLLEGTILAQVLLRGGALDVAAGDARARRALACLVVVGAVVGALAFAAQVMAVQGMVTPLVSGAQLLAEVGVFLWLSVVLLLAAGGLAAVTALKGLGQVPAGLALALAVAGVFIARLVFYATQVSAGL